MDYLEKKIFRNIVNDDALIRKLRFYEGRERRVGIWNAIMLTSKKLGEEHITDPQMNFIYDALEYYINTGEKRYI